MALGPGALVGLAVLARAVSLEAAEQALPPLLPDVKKGPFGTDEAPDAVSRTSRPTTTSTSSARTRPTRRRTPARSSTRPWTVSFEGEIAKPQTVAHRRPAEVVPARGARLPDALRRGVVDGDPVGRLPARRPREAPRADAPRRSTSRSRRCSTRSRCPGQRRDVLDWPYVEGLRIDEAMNPLALLAVGLLRPRAAEPERRAAAARGALEVRLQGDQVDREDPLRREASRRRLEPDGAERVRLLREREPRGRPPALEPGARSAASASS